MKFFVPIDLNSVRVNEGRSDLAIVHTGTDVTESYLTLTEQGWRLSRFKSCGTGERRLFERWVCSDKSTNITGKLATELYKEFPVAHWHHEPKGEDPIQKAIRLAVEAPGRPIRLRVSVNYRHEPIYSMGGSNPYRYLYKHKDITVKCDTCLAEFPRSSLKDEWLDDDCHVVRGCPKCGMSECCELEFEALTDGMRAMADRKHADRKSLVDAAGGNRYVMRRRLRDANLRLARG